LLVALVLLGVLAGSSDGRSKRDAPGAAGRVAPAAVIARRVERLRGLRFDRPPRTERVTAAQARRTALRDFDRTTPRRRSAADEELLKLLGLLPASADLRSIVGTLYREQVAGFYDPRSKRLATISGPSSAGPASDEMTLAHELTHALEDQRFGLLREAEGATAGLDDRALARLTLVEGTATALMFEYADRHLNLGETLAESLAGSFGQGGTDALPPYVLASLLFPYEQGKRFVEDLYRRLGGWGLVDYALRRRPPASSEQVLHLRKYLADERPMPVYLPPARALGVGWHAAEHGTVGEFDTRQILRAGGAAGSAVTAAEGWGGGRYALWRTGPLPDRGCAAPCRPRDALVLRWRWDTERDAGEVVTPLGDYVAAALHGRRLGGGGFALRGGAAALTRRGDEVTLAFAPRLEQARALAAAR